MLRWIIKKCRYFEFRCRNSHIRILDDPFDFTNFWHTAHSRLPECHTWMIWRCIPIRSIYRPNRFVGKNQRPLWFWSFLAIGLLNVILERFFDATSINADILNLDVEIHIFGRYSYIGRPLRFRTFLPNSYSIVTSWMSPFKDSAMNPIDWPLEAKKATICG